VVSSVGQDKTVEALDKDLVRFIEVLTLYHSSRGLSRAKPTLALNSPTERLIIRHKSRGSWFFVRKKIISLGVGYHA
jgi:hypothetical protein